MRNATHSIRRAFTLVELLVVIVIIVLVSAATLPVIVPAFNHRKVSEAARILQASLVGARDAAIRANAPRGIRLMPDPVFSGPNPLASNRMISIEPAPDYNEGRVTIFATNLPSVANNARLSITEAVFDKDPVSNPTAVPENPTNWYWNIRQGDKIRFDDSGRYYTIAGPIAIGPVVGVKQGGVYSAASGNPERYINVGGPDVFGQNGVNSPDPYVKTYSGGEILYLVNGQDDDGDGWVDEGFDGIDNDGDGIIDPGYNGLDDNGDGVIDEPAELLFSASGIPGLNEYEPEQFIGSQLSTQFINKTYTIVRRPVVSEKATEIPLPEGVVIDLTTWNAASAVSYANVNVRNSSSPERSRLPVDPYTLSVDIMIMPSGQVMLPGGGTGGVNSGGFSPQASAPFYHFWITEREDVFAPIFGVVTAVDPVSKVQIRGVPRANPNYSNGITYLLPMPNDGISGYSPPTANGVPNTAYLSGDRRLVTLFTRTGQITTNTLETFNVKNTEIPFLAPQVGVREVK